MLAKFAPETRRTVTGTLTSAATRKIQFFMAVGGHPRRLPLSAPL
jgi:hypothetical protein